jgi:hypothetical protein
MAVESRPPLAQIPMPTLPPISTAPQKVSGFVCPPVSTWWCRIAPLELAGRVALHGKLLFERHPSARAAWEATTSKIYLDELPRQNRAHRDFAYVEVSDEIVCQGSKTWVTLRNS